MQESRPDPLFLEETISMFRTAVISLLMTLCLIACDNDDQTLVATPDRVTTTRGIAVTIVVLKNDHDASGGELQVVEVTQATHGAVILNADDTVTYLPMPGFDGSDSFVYTLSNDQGSLAETTVTVTVLPEEGIVLRGILYTLTRIGLEPPSGPIVTVGLGINDSGQVVGWLSGLDPLAYLFDHGTFSYPSVGFSSVASDINNRGDIVGSFSDTNCNGLPWISRGFLLAGNGNLTPIDFPGVNPQPCEPDGTFAEGINETSQIVGRFTDSDGTHGFFLNGGMFSQLDVPGATETMASGINDASQIVGSFTDADGTHGFFLDGGMFSQLDVPDATETMANGINNASQIVGSFTDADGTHGFFLDGGMFSPFNIPNTDKTRANGMNNRGQIVGSFRVPQAPPQTGFFTGGYVATPLEHDPFAIFNGQ